MALATTDRRRLVQRGRNLEYFTDVLVGFDSTLTASLVNARGHGLRALGLLHVNA